MGILEKRGPPNLIGPLSWLFSGKQNDLHMHYHDNGIEFLIALVQDTFPYDLIRTIFEEKRLLPIIGMDLSKEMLLVLGTPLTWNFSSNQVICNMRIP